MTGLTAAMNAHRRDVRHLARHQILGLTAQFLLGMAVDLLGLPSQATGAAQTASTVFLAAHVLIAVGLAVGAILVIGATAGLRTSRAAWRSAAAPPSPPLSRPASSP